MELTSKKFMLSGLLILGFVCTGYATNGNDDYNMQGDDDYQYDDETVSHNPKPTMSVQKATVPPIFEVNAYTKHVRPGENAILDCPVKNLGENNVVMWLNETTVLTQNKKPTTGRVSISKNYTLTIFNTTKYDSHVYVCNILPQKLELRAKLHVSDEPNHAPEEQSQSQKDDHTADSSGARVQFGAIASLSSLLAITINQFLRI